jgi:hypothetical protein
MSKQDFLKEIKEAITRMSNDKQLNRWWETG